jgi:BirA family transcriptional regulator, biotin operon repressor / biotin---[acetyl-CoA-carboxylase] ligase
MTDLMYPAILDDLGQAEDTGLPLIAEPEFQRQLQLCRDWGFFVQTLEDRVRLRFDHDQLIPAWIEKETPALAWDKLRIKGFLRLNSTNSEALNLAIKGAPAGTLVLAEEQTTGRGRKDRKWLSHPGAGLCCSLIVRPRQEATCWPLLTLVTSIALVDALKDLCRRNVISVPLEIDIKWPNDVLLSGRKCAGILLETAWNDMENPAAIVGFGINVRRQNVPESLKLEAVSLDEVAHGIVPRRQLLVRFLHAFQLRYLAFEQGRHAELLDCWKSYSSMWNGVSVWIGEGDMRREAVTCGLSETGALLVRNRNGVLETLFAETIRLSAGAQREKSDY